MIDQLRNQINEYFIGKEEVVENLLTCLLAGGHVLLEDFPGVGKTTVARILAGSIDASFGRIQFTPDTLPSDITGFLMFNMKTSQFEYKEGAIMRQIILADEINRTSPKTQSALIETLQEGSVTVDSHRYHLPTPFMVIATQNPVEFIGTFSLPEQCHERAQAPSPPAQRTSSQAAWTHLRRKSRRHSRRRTARHCRPSRQFQAARPFHQSGSIVRPRVRRSRRRASP